MANKIIQLVNPIRVNFSVQVKVLVVSSYTEKQYTASVYVVDGREDINSGSYSVNKQMDIPWTNIACIHN